MEIYENGSSPENNNENNKPLNPDLNRDGGVFAEEDFSEKLPDAPQNNYPPYQPYGAPTGNGYSQGNGYPQGGYPGGGALPADAAYKQMYSGAAPDNRGYNNAAQPVNGFSAQPQQNNAAQGYSDSGNFSQDHSAADSGSGGDIPPQNGSGGNVPYGGYYYQPQVGAMSAPAPEPEMKKSSKGWVIAVVIIVVLMFSVVMLLLAFGHKDEGLTSGIGETGDTVQNISSDGSNGVTVNINVAPKPVENEEFYQNKETGLLTPAGAANQVLPSIVNLYGYTSTTLQPYNEASGIIISEDGYIITNAHATEDITRFKAKLNDEREFEAKLIGADTRTDLAVLKIEADGLVPAVIGSSSEMVQGEEVIAIGNAGGFNDSVTVGNVSYVDREIKSYTGYPIKCIQTDAALNFGNSGGALVNLYGQVVGIVVSKYSSTGSENIGFAISSDFAVPVVEDIMEKGYVTGRARIGIIYKFISPDTAERMEIKPGLLVAEIAEDCDVSNTELQPDDIITEIDGIQMITQNSVKEFQNTHKAGDVVTAKVYRLEFNGEEREFEITFTLEEQK